MKDEKDLYYEISTQMELLFFLFFYIFILDEEFILKDLYLKKHEILEL